MCGVEAFAVHRCAVPRYFAGRLGEVTVDNIMQIRSWAGKLHSRLDTW